MESTYISDRAKQYSDSRLISDLEASYVCLFFQYVHFLQVHWLPQTAANILLGLTGAFKLPGGITVSEIVKFL